MTAQGGLATDEDKGQLPLKPSSKPTLGEAEPASTAPSGVSLSGTPGSPAGNSTRTWREKTKSSSLKTPSY